MKREKSIKQAFDFLKECLDKEISFTSEELSKASGWTLENTQTNLGKRLKDLVKGQDNVFIVKPEISRVRFNDFKDLFRQKQRLFADYKNTIYRSVLVYEFFMPLAREDRLREALDNLFYKDTVEQRIKEIGIENIRNSMSLSTGLTDENIKSIVLEIIDNNIGGYSLNIVNGRFRVGSLSTKQDVIDRPYSEGPYIIDETTAIVKFIIPMNQDNNHQVNPQISLFEPAEPQQSSDEKADQMRWLFLQFFAEAIVKMVRKEDEIWLLESGVRNALYQWVCISE